MKEEEAKTKQCQVRFLAATFATTMVEKDEFSQEDVEGMVEAANCIASDCMMWKKTSGSLKEPFLEGYCGLTK